MATIQLDELKTFVHQKDALSSAEEKALGAVGSQWAWTAIDPVSKLWLVAHVGPRTKAMACCVIHFIGTLLAAGCVPAFTSDGLMHYCYALTAHFGQWETDAQGKDCWQVSSLITIRSGDQTLPPQAIGTPGAPQAARLSGKTA